LLRKERFTFNDITRYNIDLKVVDLTADITTMEITADAVLNGTEITDMAAIEIAAVIVVVKIMAAEEIKDMATGMAITKI
jgi:hypothetical protein